MLQGYRGFIGLALTLLGSLGFFEYLGVSKDEFSLFLDNIVQVVGFILTMWGYVSAKLRMEKAGLKTDKITEAIAGK